MLRARYVPRSCHIGMFGAIMYLPLFVQAVIGTSATGSGAVLTPLMLGFIVSSIVGGQILARTGRYKIMALSGFVGAGIGMFLRSRMTSEATSGLVMRNMVVTGLGMGVMMSLFTIVVQNAFPVKQMGEVSSSLQFFRSIGGTMGVAILGSIMSSRFQSQLDQNIPAALKDPQVLLAPEATVQLKQSFAAFGAQGETLFNQLMEAIRQSLTTSITGLFFAGMVFMVLGFGVTLFLREIPLRRTHHDAGSDLAGLGEGVMTLDEDRDQELAGLVTHERRA